MPQVSVILSSLNHARFLPEAIESVLQQTFTDFEFFIIDDASEDNSWEIICRYQDPRIIAIRNPKRMRGAYGFNEVIHNRAQGEFIAIHHSDDAWAPQKLEKQVAFLLEHAEMAGVFTQAQLIDEHGLPFENETHAYHALFNQHNRHRYAWLKHFFLHGNCLCHPSVLARRGQLLQAGLYDRRLGQLTDLDLWVRLCFQSEIHILQEALIKFRILNREANQSGNREEARSRIRHEWSVVLERYLHRCDEEIFLKIFPELKESSPQSHWPFLLAMMALDTNEEAKKSIGMNLLYSLFEDCRTAETIFEKHHFGYTDLIALSGKIDPFYTNEILSLRSELSIIKRSWWWKLCAPIRVCDNFCKKLINHMRSD